MSDEITVVINGELKNDESAQVGPEFTIFPSIFKVPEALVIGNENRYEPLVASFGPYHHQKKKFEVTEDHKMLYVQSLIARRTPLNVNATFDTLIADIDMVKVEARACYAEKLEIHIAQVNSDTVGKFVEMMVIDGCFLLEILYKYKEHEKLLSDVAAAAEEVDCEMAATAVATMCEKDPIFRSRRIICSVRRDMVLVENQLPFTVLHRLFTLTSDPNYKFSLAQLVGDFMAPIIPWTAVNGNYDGVNSHHLLDLLRRYLIGTFVGTPLAQLVGNQDVRTCENQILSAVELSRGGIFIRSNNYGDSGPLGITIITRRKSLFTFVMMQKRLLAFIFIYKAITSPRETFYGAFTSLRATLLASANFIYRRALTSPRETLSFISRLLVCFSLISLREIQSTISESLRRTSPRETLEIPSFIYGEGLTILIPNIIALEQCHDYYSKYFSSYAILLAGLVKSKEDVKLLRLREVIYASHIEDEKVATGISNLCSGVQSDEFYYGKVSHQLKKNVLFHLKTWEARITSWVSNDPLISIKILVAICTVAQTVFAVLAFIVAQRFKGK